MLMKIGDFFSPEDRLLYAVSEEDVQETAKKQIGRHLTEQELRAIAKGLEWGLGDPLADSLETAIDLATG